jgi:hypothetical protein
LKAEVKQSGMNGAQPAETETAVSSTRITAQLKLTHWYKRKIVFLV